MDFSGFNWLALIVAALSAFAIGGLWYGPLFGIKWQRLNDLSDEQMAEANMGLIFGSAFVLNLFLALMLSMAMGSSMNTVSGLVYGGSLGLAFVAPTFAINYLFARRAMALYVIDVGYMVFQLAVMGAIMGALS